MRVSYLTSKPPKSFLIDQGEIAGKRGEREAQNSIEIENFLGTVSQQSSEAFNPGIIQDLVEESTEPKTNYYNGTVTTLDESIDMQVEENDLELETQDANAYFNQENNNQFVNDYYDPAGLEAIGVNINDFQGYLNKIDFSEDFEEDLQAGVYGSYDEDDAASLAVAKERAIATALGNYIGDTDAKANEKEFLKDYEANPEKYNDTEDFREAYKKYAEENKLGTLYNSNQASEYAENNFQNLLEKEKQSAEKRDAEYARKQSMGNSGIASTSAYNFLEGTAEGAYAEAMSMVNFIDDKLGFDAIAKQRRILTAEDGYADASKALDYMHIKGDGVTWVDGKEYIRDYDGNLYNKTDNTRVSGVIPAFEEESINKAIDKDGAFMSDWSATGTSATVGGVTGALIFQIAGQYGLGLGVKGAAKLASASGATTRALATANGYSSVKKYNKAVSLLKGTKGKVWTGKKFTTLKGAKDFKLPVSQKIIESTVFQSMYGGVTGYEGTLQAAKEAGLSNEEAESLALQAQTEMGVLYAATGPINPRLRALEKLDNIIAGGNIFKQAVNNFKKAGNSKLIFRETLAKKGKEAMRTLAKGGNSFLQEGAKETIQENIQQAGEYLIVNKGLNEEAGVDFLKDTYTQQDIVDTSILSAAIGGLAGGNLKLNFKANQNERLQNLFFVGKDIKSAKTKFDYLVKKGKITQKEADTIIEQAEAVANTSEGIPSWMQNSPEAIIESAVILNKIKKLEADKKRLAETYHEEVNNDIEAAYSELKTIKDKAAKELTIKEAAKVTKIAGKENVTTYNSVDEMKAAGVDESKLNSDGIFEKDGKIIINLEVAARTKAISVGSHELLHRILRSELKNNKNLGKVINEFRDILKTSGELENIEKRLQFGIDQGVYDIKFNKDGTVSGADIDEYITFFSDAVAKKEISFDLLNEPGWKKMGRVIFNAIQTRFGTKAKEFKSGKQVFNFIRDYRSTLDKSGKLTNQAKSKLKASGKELDGDAKKSLTKPTVLESINSLVPENVTTKADFQNRKVFNAVYAATEPGGAISNYVRSKSESKEVADKAMESVVDRLINYDPAAVRKKANGDPITFGEFIFANTNFGKLDARKSLAIEAKETARKVSIDSEQAKEIADKDTATDPRDTGKPKRMNLVTRGVISAEAVSKAQETVKRAIGALKVPFNKKTSLNVTVKPYIAALKKGFAEKELVKAVAQDMGNGGDLKSWMRKHKAAILDNMTTTYLIGAFPAAIQKQVKGTDTWTSDWAGKEIQREKTTTASAGRTSGAFMVRRLPNASSKISDAEFVGMLFDDKGVIKPGKKPSLAKAIAEEIGFDILTTEIQNPDGQIAEAFKDNQEALGVVMLENTMVTMQKDAERGSAKFSIALVESFPALFYNSLEGGDKDVFDSYYNDLTEADQEEWQRLSEPLINSIEATIKVRKEFIKVLPKELQEISKKLTENVTNKKNPAALKSMAEFNEALLNKLPAELTSELTVDTFSINYNYLNVKKDTGAKLKKLKDAKKPTGVALTFDASAVQPIQAGTGLMLKIQKLNYKDFTEGGTISEAKAKENKEAALEEQFGQQIRDINAANPAALAMILEASLEVVMENPLLLEGFLRTLEGQSMMGQALRGLTGIAEVEVHGKSQGVYRNTETNDFYGKALTEKQRALKEKGLIVVNKEHPNYKAAIDFIQRNNKPEFDKSGTPTVVNLMNFKGEHLMPSAQVWLGVGKVAIQAVTNAKKYPNALGVAKAQATVAINNEILGFDQQLNSKVLSELQDKKMGATNKSGYFRLKSYGVGKYGRVLGEIFIQDSEGKQYNINEQLKIEGHAYEYHGGKKQIFKG